MTVKEMEPVRVTASALFSKSEKDDYGKSGLGE
jgi:hypothetical protein